MRKRDMGFTLIELLVVITIVVILLALLAPALDQAVYQAELALCMTNLKGIATGAQIYAADQKRHYPDRAVVARSPSWRAMQLTWKLAADEDDRPIVGEYFDINGLMNDPLAPAEVDLLNTDADSNVYANVNLWYGWKWINERGMLRLGDRFTLTNNSGPVPTVYHFSLLASDLDAFTFDGVEQVQAGHPDRDGVLFSYGFQDEIALGIKWTYRHWASGGGKSPRRGLMDRNFAHADGSVARFNEVLPSDTERLIRVNHYGVDSAWKDFIPADHR